MNSRAFRTDFESHSNLIHSFARKGFGRLQAARVLIDYEDVYQEMCISFVKAQKMYNPDSGFSFTAYFGRAVWNDFNKLAERLIGEKVAVGMESVEDFRHEEDDGQDIYAFLSVETDSAESPEDMIEHNQEFIAHFGKCMRQLSPESRRVVAQFLAPSETLKQYHAAKRAKYMWSIKMGVRESPVAETMSLEFVIRNIVDTIKARSRVREEIKQLIESVENGK